MPEKTRKTKKAPEKEAKKPQLNKKLLAVSITLAFIIIIGAVLYQHFWQTPESEIKFPLKAAIIDQLGGSIQSSQSFRENVTNLLVNQNFTVVYNGSVEVNVKFFKKVPKSNCGLYILRVHSAVRNNTDQIDFFTNEPYNENLYREYGDRLSIGWYYWDPDKKYFAISPSFVEIMDGTFPKSIIIAMGCKSLKYRSMAQAFLNKGAQLYIGWTDDVYLYDSDRITFRLLELLFKENKTINDAVKECNRIPRQNSKSELDFFPKNISDKKISEIIYVSSDQAPSMLNSQGQIFIAAPVKRSSNLKRTD